MLSERILTGALRYANKRVLSLERDGGVRFPGPGADTSYMLYAHVPFCTKLCPYCSFNRFPFKEDLARGYYDALRREMRLVADAGYDIKSLYFGGGTPTILVDELAQTIDHARDLFDIREVSSETNPNHLVPQVLDVIEGRVQRLSVGVQSLDDDLLRRMERHEKYGNSEQTLQRIDEASGRFLSLNVDMIFNFPSQSETILRSDVRKVKGSGCNQVTFYPLMTSPGVRHRLSQSVGRVDYQREYDYYRILLEELEDSFDASCAWTFSRNGGGQMIDEYIVDYEQYVGIGSGSFSYVDGAIYVNTFSLAEYARMVDSGQMSATAMRAFSKKERMAYRFMMDLFGLELDKKRFEEDYGVPVERGCMREIAFMRAVRAFDVDDADKLVLSDKGRYLLVAMMREFFSGVNAFREQAREALPADERAALFQGEQPDPVTSATMDA